MAVERAVAQTTRPAVDYRALEEMGRALILSIGEDPDREGLVGTPRRWARWWKEFIQYDPGVTDSAFESVTTDQMIVVSGIRVWSLCEHHLLPFWCDIAVGYIADDKVLGLSKFARIAHQMAHRLQLQERLVHDIADEVERLAGSDNVAVLGQGKHTCMIMRGIKTEGLFTTSVMRGAFRSESEARAEFFKIVELGK